MAKKTITEHSSPADDEHEVKRGYRESQITEKEDREEKKKRRKKKKRDKTEVETEGEDVVKAYNEPLMAVEEEVNKKKKKKKREKTEVETEGEDVEKAYNEPLIIAEEEVEEIKKKKKKKKREKIEVETEEGEDVEKAYNVPLMAAEGEVEEIKKKKKKKKREKTEVETVEGEDVEKAYKAPLTAVEVAVEENKKKQEAEKIEEKKVKIETVHEHPEKISPLVGYFPSGFDPLKRHSFKSQDSDQQPLQQPRVEVFRNVRRKSRLQLVVSPNGSQMNFVGTNYAGEAIAAQVCTYALGVLDKVTKTLKIVPIAGNKVFRLEPRVDVPELSDNESSDILKEELTVEDRADKFKDLAWKYSTKRAIGQLKKMESLHRKQDPKSQEELNRKLDDIEIDKEAFEEAGTTSDARNIPPYDMNATTPQMAYPLDKIIFKGDWDFLLDILELSQIGAQVRPDVYPSFVCNRVYKLEDSKDEETKQTLACIFSYITHLIKFKDKHSMDGVSSAKNHKIPSIFSLRFSDMFGNPVSKRLADGKKDLLISYVLVLTLFADDFRSDPSDIARDLRVEAGTLRSHYEHLGCKAVRDQNATLFTLPVPLQFQAVRRKRQRKGR